MLILCVDDEPSVLILHKLVLEKYGYEVVTASNGAEALEIFRNQPVNGVVLDYLMPGMNGAQVAAAMKKCGAQIPIIMISACLSVPDEAMEAVDCFVQKP